MLNLNLIKNLSNTIKFRQGDVISNAGAGHAAVMYIIVKGEVAVYRNYQKDFEAEVSTLYTGSFFGEKSLFLGKSDIMTYIAKCETVILPLSSASATNFIKSESAFVFDFLRELCEHSEILSGEYVKLSGKLWMPPSIPPVVEQQPPAPKEEDTDAKEAPESSEPLSSLFPPKHKNKKLPIDNTKMEYLYEKTYTCPLCKKTVKTLKVKASKLIAERTEPDLRVRYKNIEPIYYEVVTCPNCLYSAFNDIFDTARKNNNTNALLEELKQYKKELVIKDGANRDTITVFAGFYLALICAPKCFYDHPMVTAKLLQMLCRAYSDCGDREMEELTVVRARDAYLYLYEHVNLDVKKNSQVCVMIAELSLKTGNAKQARDFFFKAKTDKLVSQVIKRHAEDRIEDLRAAEADSSEA